MHFQSSESVAPGTTERGNDKGKQRGELIAHIQAFSPDVRCSPAESSRPSAAHSPHRSQRLRPSTARRVWTITGSSRHRPPVSESIIVYL